MRPDLTGFIRRATDLRVLNVMVTQDGELLASHDWEQDIRRNAYSASKSFTSAAVGIAQREGLLSVDEKLTDAFAADLPEKISPELEAARVADLLTMSLGHDRQHLMGEQRVIMEEEDWVKYAIAQPLAYRPGEHFQYNNIGPYLAGVLVQRRAGQKLTDYLQPRLFDPLGIRHTVWEEDPRGYTFGAGGLMISTKELNKLGLLYVQEGRWNGRQILPAEWVRDTMSVHSAPCQAAPFGYGYLCWGAPEGTWVINGKYCQLSFVSREKNAVITMMSECRDKQGLFDAVFEEIWPQL